jgi:protein-L-isoaspartate(D-aspartate) O-methyltransferase
MTADLAQLREELAAHVGAMVVSPAVLAALRDVPRHLFVPGVTPAEAYRDEAIVTKRDRAGVPVSSSSQPAIMAIMLDQLALAPGHRVLEIGAGTGYNAALISHITGPAGQVTSIDIDPDVVREATWHLAAAGFPGVTVVAADGADGFAGHAPYDRLIATVGVSDLAPAWLSQLTPCVQKGGTGDAVIVVPLDVGGVQLSVAFERASGTGGGGHWASRSVAPCGFMRMRGAMAGSALAVPLGPGLRLLLPAGRTLDASALAAALDAAPTAVEPTGVSAAGPQVFWGLNLWLAVSEPRAAELDEELVPGVRAPRLASPPVHSRSFQASYGIVSDAGGVAVLAAPPDNGLEARGYGQDAAALAAELAGQVRAWDAAGRPGTEGLRVDAYPRDGVPPPETADVVVERPSTRFVLYRA